MTEQRERAPLRISGDCKIRVPFMISLFLARRRHWLRGVRSRPARSQLRPAATTSMTGSRGRGPYPLCIRSSSHAGSRRRRLYAREDRRLASSPGPKKVCREGRKRKTAKRRLREGSRLVRRSQVGLLTSLVAELFEFGALHGAQAACEGGLGTILPCANHEDDQTEAENQCHDRHDPRGAVKASGGGSGEHGGP